MEMYNFETDEWTMLETAPEDFWYFFFSHGNSLYCPRQQEEVMWVYTYGQGWVAIENDGKMEYDLGHIVIL